jgi:hypothetical protein
MAACFANYGAVEIGVHRFRHPGTIMTWEKRNSLCRHEDFGKARRSLDDNAHCFVTVLKHAAAYAVYRAIALSIQCYRGWIFIALATSRSSAFHEIQ